MAVVRRATSWVLRRSDGSACRAEGSPMTEPAAPLHSPLFVGVPAFDSREPFEIPFARASRTQAGRVDLQLAGSLPNDWALRLTRALTARRMNLLSGCAQISPSRRWLARLEIELPSESPPLPDFGWLARHGEESSDLPRRKFIQTATTRFHYIRPTYPIPSNGNRKPAERHQCPGDGTG